MLFNMGVCAFYSEATWYEASAMQSEQPSIHPDSFKQFVFNNADFNIWTLDGYGTFHSMRGIMCITPRDEVEKAAVTKLLENSLQMHILLKHMKENCKPTLLQPMLKELVEPQ